MVKQAAETLAHSVMLAAFSRLIVAVGTPVMLGALMWFAGNFIALREMVAVQASIQSRVVVEVADLQNYRRDAYARGVARDKEDKALRDAVEDLKKSVDRMAIRGNL